MENMSQYKKDRYVLITGASKGLGYELAKLFAQQHYNLILVARGEKELKRVSAELEEKYNIESHSFACDLSVLSEIDKLYQSIMDKQFKVSMLINNAGFGYWGKFEEIGTDRQIEMLNLNITGLTHLTRLFITDMLSSGFGKILNISSIASFSPIPFVSTYAASKSYVTNFSRALNHEFKSKNIKVSVSCPPDFISGFQEAAGNPDLVPKGPYFGTAAGVAKITFDQFMKNKEIITPYTFFGKLVYYAENYAPIPDTLIIMLKKWIVEKDYVLKK